MVRPIPGFSGSGDNDGVQVAAETSPLWLVGSVAQDTITVMSAMSLSPETSDHFFKAVLPAGLDIVGAYLPSSIADGGKPPALPSGIHPVVRQRI